MIVTKLKRHLIESDLFRKAWAYKRSSQLLKRYRGWAERYGKTADDMGLVYSPETAAKDVKTFLKRQGYSPKKKRVGQIHTAIFSLNHNFGIGVLDELEELGPVTSFDYQAEGFRSDDPAFQKRIPELNQRMVAFLREVHLRRPLDWILVTHSGAVMLKETVRRMREEFGVPVVNQWLDCKQSFECGPGPHGQDLGQRDIAPEFDCVWTSSRSVCEWYMALGARPVFLPEGFSPKFTPRVHCERVRDVGFVGACYGLRPDYINALKKTRLSVVAAGYGWPDSYEVPNDEMGRFISSSRVNLGMGGVAYSMSLTTLKARDFDIPGAGGAYLTTFNPDLAHYFHIGKEILCYHSMEEMVELAGQLIRDDAMRETLADNGYARAMRDHRWLHRFKALLSILGVIEERSVEFTLDGKASCC